MNKRSASLWVLLSLAGAGAVAAQAPPAPVMSSPQTGAGGHAGAPPAAPRYPTTPPPPVAAAPLNGTGYKIPLRTGWNLVSFPFAQVTTVRGLDYALIRPHGSGSSIVDPVHQGRDVDTRFGYWAYAGHPGAIEVAGAGGPMRHDVLLEPGWNLLGCPTPGNLTVTRIAGNDGKTVAYTNAFGGVGSTAQLPLAPGTTLQPGGAYWVYAYRPGTLEWQPAAGVISTAGSQRPPAGSPAARQMEVGRQAVAATQGGMAVVRGRVTDHQGFPLYRAQVVFSGTQGLVRTRTDTGGYFTANVVAGPQQISVITRTCQPAYRKIIAEPGQNPPIALEVAHRFGTIAVHMYDFDYQEGHYRPTKVEMWQTDIPTYHYTDYYNRRWRRGRTDAYWKPFPLGAGYTVQVTWEDQNGSQQWLKTTGTAMNALTNVYFDNSWKTY